MEGDLKFIISNNIKRDLWEIKCLDGIASASSTMVQWGCKVTGLQSLQLRLVMWCTYHSTASWLCYVILHALQSVTVSPNTFHINCKNSSTKGNLSKRSHKLGTMVAMATRVWLIHIKSIRIFPSPFILQWD
jgi:hypothetical protein